MPRKSIRGLGANLYAPPAGPSNDQPTSAPANQYASDEAPQGKATFYLSPQTLDELDRAWLTRRGRDRRVSKSSLVEQALRDYLAKASAA
jgi:hypothetical protein